MVLATQRPSHFPPDIWTAALVVWIHPLGHRADVAALEQNPRLDYDALRWRPVVVGGKPHKSAVHPIVWRRGEGLSGGAEGPGERGRCPTCGRSP